MKEKLEKIRLSCLEQIESAKEQNVLEDVRVTFLGKKGELTSILKEVGKLSQEERPLVGKIVNEIREEIETKLQEKKEILEKEAILKQLENDIWECLIKGAKKVSNGTKLVFDESLLKAEVIEKYREL